MPNRILRDWTDSLRFESLSAEAERLFVRLIMKTDDFGRFHADPRLIRAACFPLRDDISAEDISRNITELEKVGLLTSYEVKGRSYLAINNFRQRLRTMQGKFPAPDGKNVDWSLDDNDGRLAVNGQPNDGQLTVNGQSDDGLKRIETNKETKRNEASKGLVASRKAVDGAVKAAIQSTASNPVSGENELITTCKRLFGSEEIAENGGLWRTRARQDADKLGRCLNELQRAIREGETIKNRAAYVTDLWGRFA